MGISPVEIRSAPEEIRVEANLVSKNAEFFVEQHIQNPPKSVSGKNFNSEIVLNLGSFHMSVQQPSNMTLPELNKIQCIGYPTGHM